jgi:hypothetical protein
MIHVFRIPKSALTLAIQLYKEAMLVPYMLTPVLFMYSGTPSLP